MFKLQENKTTVSRELQAGLTTFAAMAYILAVNPAILANSYGAGMNQAALVTITALSAATATILMALMTNYPLALAPGMGINAMFSFYICGQLQVPWSDALGMVCINGCIFLLLSLTGVRERIVKAIPHSLKIAITCGIGMFIAFIGLKNAGVIVSNPATFVAAGDFTGGSAALCLAGIVLIAILVARRVPGAIVIGILAITIVGAFVTGTPATGAEPAKMVTQLPGSLAGFFSLPSSPEPHFLKLTFGFLTTKAAFFAALPVILTLLLIDMFDNIGTLIGVTKRAGFLDKDGNLPKVGRALVADSIAAILSSLFGTSTVVSYVESASGVEAGGRTGLTSVTTAVLMLLALFLTPLILAIPAAATAPALVIVGVFMMQSVIEIKMEDFATAVPAILTIFAIPLTFSIAEGIGIGLISAVLLAVFTGKARSISLVGYAIAVIFFLQFFKIFPF
ncbi:NCS2 family permease [Termitidicoccus mucosus]|uniref:Guanine permease n=1 Tax=Termitidicoccus mucosus TaxID=1184151 RepID=A0A178IN66_9BACT|nr:guanine permease [Opitutaceae bacterium TSB47]